MSGARPARALVRAGAERLAAAGVASPEHDAAELLAHVLGTTRSRLLQAAEQAAESEASDARRLQVRTVDRSERIRTYNFAENRVSDHRTGYKAYNLDHVLAGDLAPLLESCVAADLAARLDALER